MAVAKTKFGACIHNRAAVFMPQQGLDYDLNRLVDLAAFCEELGFYSVSVGDSFLAKPRYQSIPTMAAIAARTKRIRILSHILQPHLYNNPVILAQQLTTIDVISRGRLIVGVGLGNGKTDLVEKEYQVFRVPKKRRGKVFEETLVVLKKLWTDGVATHHGDFYDFEDVSIGYEPVQKPHPPLWIAAGVFYTGDRGPGWFADRPRGFSGPLDRVARLGDGWLTQQATPEEYRDGLEQIRRVAREQYGRDGEAIEGAMNRGIFVTTDVEKGMDEVRWFERHYQNMPVPDEVLQRWNTIGTPEACIGAIRPFIEAGVRTLVICVRGKDPFDQVRRIAEDVVPAFA